MSLNYSCKDQEDVTGGKKSGAGISDKWKRMGKDCGERGLRTFQQEAREARPVYSEIALTIHTQRVQKV